MRRSSLIREPDAEDTEMRTCKEKQKFDGYLARMLAGLMITTAVTVGSLAHAVLNLEAFI